MFRASHQNFQQTNAEDLSCSYNWQIYLVSAEKIPTAQYDCGWKDENGACTFKELAVCTLISGMWDISHKVCLSFLTDQVLV
jgi:hypothetical protein